MFYLKNSFSVFLRLLIVLFLIISITYTFAQSAEDLIHVGKAKIVDGDTIHINKLKYRLHGIDAPEIKQECKVNKKSYSCGLKSKIFLESLIKDEEIRCKQKDIDKYKRIVAICFVNGLNINQEMVKAGWAIAYRYYSKDYVKDELFAENSKLGIWKGTFLKPKDWRKKNR